MTRERVWAVAKHWGGPIVVALFVALGYINLNARWTKHVEQHRVMEQAIGILNYAIESGQIRLPKR